MERGECGRAVSAMTLLARPAGPRPVAGGERLGGPVGRRGRRGVRALRIGDPHPNGSPGGYQRHDRGPGRSGAIARGPFSSPSAALSRRGARRERFSLRRWRPGRWATRPRAGPWRRRSPPAWLNWMAPGESSGRTVWPSWSWWRMECWRWAVAATSWRSGRPRSAKRWTGEAARASTWSAGCSAPRRRWRAWRRPERWAPAPIRPLPADPELVRLVACSHRALDALVERGWSLGFGAYRAAAALERAGEVLEGLGLPRLSAPVAAALFAAHVEKGAARSRREKSSGAPVVEAPSAGAVCRCPVRPGRRWPSRPRCPWSRCA